MLDLGEKLDEGILVGAIGTLLGEPVVLHTKAHIGGVYLVPSPSMPHSVGGFIEAVS